MKAPENVKPIEVIEDWDLNFNIGKVVENIASYAGSKRAEEKIKILNEAEYAIKREIKKLTGNGTEG